MPNWKKVVVSGSDALISHLTASGGIKGDTITGTVATATQATIDHDSLANFVANEHIDHSGVSVVAGTGLTGGGTIASNRTLNVIGGTGITANANDIAITDGGVDTTQLADDAVDADKLAANAVVNASVASSAAIAYSKLAAMASGKILVGNGSNVATVVGMSGDASIANNGAVTLASSQTNINSILATDLVLGEDSQTKIDFETANEIHLDANNAEVVKVRAGGIEVTGQITASQSIFCQSSLSASGVIVPTGTVTAFSGSFSSVHVAADNGRLVVGAGGDLKVYHNGTNTFIDNETGDLSITSAGDIILDADGTDIMLKDDGTEFGRFKRDSSDFIIKSATNNKDIVFRGVDNSSTITALTLDMSDAGKALFNSHISASGGVTASNFTGSFTGDGSSLTGITAAPEIDGLNALGGTGLHQSQDHFVFSDNGTEKKITFSNLEDAIFGNVSGDATIAAGGALTIANTSVETEMIGDNAVDADKLAANAVVNASVASSAAIAYSKLAAMTSARILVGNGSNVPTVVAVSGDATLANNGAVTLAAAQTNVNSILATDLVLGEDSQTKIDFETANEIHFDANNAQVLNVKAGGIDVTGNIVPSGNVSGSATSTGSFGQVVVSSLLSRANDANTGLQFGSDTVSIEGNNVIAAAFKSTEIELNLPVTASAEVSASGNVYGQKFGRDVDNLIDFSTDNQIRFRVNGGDEANMTNAFFYPHSNDGMALGQASTSWSDLFLASGAVINFNNGDITLTHTSNHLTFAGGTLVVPTLNLGQADHLITDGSNFLDSSDNTIIEFADDSVTFQCSTLTAGIGTKTSIGTRKWARSSTTNNNLSAGDVTYTGGEGTIAAGDIVYLDTSGNWQKAQANSTTKSIGLLGIALGNNAGNNGILLRGMFTLDHDVANNQGIPLYLSDTTAGQAITTAPDTSGDIVRIIGYNLGDDDQIWFSPDNTFVQVA